jgi:hypothetical protein
MPRSGGVSTRKVDDLVKALGIELGRLREKLAAHASRDGVWFDSRVWIVKARRR